MPTLKDQIELLRSQISPNAEIQPVALPQVPVAATPQQPQSSFGQNDLIAQAILGLAPILAGAAFGGAQGGAIGSEAGSKALGVLQTEKQRELEKAKLAKAEQGKMLETALKLSQEERAQKAAERAETRQTEELAISKQKLSLEEKRLMAELGSSKRQLEQLNPANKTMVESLSKDSATKTAIANEIAQTVKLFDDPNISDTQKIKAGESLLKVLNSTQGSDAVGAEEAKRLGSLLQFQIGNLFGPGKFIGRDLPGFRDQAATTVNRLSGAVEGNKKLINEALANKPVGIEPIQLLEQQKKKPGMPLGTTPAFAAPPAPDFSQMSDEQLKKYLGL